jgi:predicted transcriptional regulator
MLRVTSRAAIRQITSLENEELVAGFAKRFRVSTMALQHRLQNK